MKRILVLPAYNEEESLPDLLRAVRETPVDTVVVVDDGSVDGTREVLQDWSPRIPLDVVVHRENSGLGATILDGLKRAAELAAPGDVIVTMDSDNSHDPALIDRMVLELEKGVDIVIASRYRSGSKVVGLSVFRIAMSFGARLLFQYFLPTRGVRDYTCGFRAYRASFLKRLLEQYGDSLVTERGFACMAEILLKAGKSSARFSEVPLVLRYDCKKGVSKMRLTRTITRTLQLIARNAFSSARHPRLPVERTQT
jgi:dolichol-phosphate mannosyltransferase